MVYCRGLQRRVTRHTTSSLPRVMTHFVLSALLPIYISLYGHHYVLLRQNQVKVAVPNYMECWLLLCMV